jgi:hypothetical protein
MSNHLAIATVTAVLQRTLQAAVQRDVEGARVTTVMPSQVGSGTPETGVNLFLYQVSRNAALQNPDAAVLRSRNKTSSKRQTALELHYMLSFYGSNIDLEPQRLMGSVVRALSDRAVLTSDLIVDTISDNTFGFLTTSDLADQIQQLSVLPLDLNLEDMSKVWSVFFQTAYILSLAYKVTVVMIDGEDQVPKALPVRDRRLTGVTALAGQPVIQEVRSHSGKLAPILTSSTLVIKGWHLQGSVTQVRIGGVEITPPDVSDTQITLPLTMLPTSALRAGIQSLQVVHGTRSQQHSATSAAPTMTALAPPQTRVTESNAFPFVLRPAITDVAVEQVDGSGLELRHGVLQISLNLTVQPQQRVVIGLNEWTTEQPAIYLFDADKRETETQSFPVSIRDVKAGEYLVRVLVDGAESQLEVDHRPDSPTFNWYISPKVLIL